MISSFIADADAIERLLGEGELRLDTDITNRDGATIAVEVAARTIPYGEGTARLLEFRDVGERKHTQARVSFLAHHDPLTALPNRELMRARLEQAVDQQRQAAHRLRRFGSISTISRTSTTSTATWSATKSCASWRRN